MTTTDVPLVGAVDDVKQRDETDERMWSVTTLIGVLDKAALVPWAAKATAEAAVDNLDVVQARLNREGRSSAVDYLKGARYWKPKGSNRTSTELGTAVHEACETYALTGVRPQVDAEVAPYLRQFDRFLDEFQPTYQATEVTVYSPTWSYAGTCDAFMTIGGRRLIADYKTSRDSWDYQGRPKGPYSEVALQLAAYRHAEYAAVFRARRVEEQRRRYYLLSEAEKQAAVPVPEVDDGIAIYLTPEQYGVYPVACGDAIFEWFKYVVEVARWHFEASKFVIRNRMIPPYPRPPADDDPFAGLPTE